MDRAPNSNDHRRQQYLLQLSASEAKTICPFEECLGKTAVLAIVDSKKI